jgi:hypothetical protein
LTLLGVVLFVVSYAASRGLNAFRLELSEFEGAVAPLLIIAVLVVLVVAHEWLHGLTMRRLGARPAYGVGTFGRVLPIYAYCTTPGHRFTRAQFAMVSAAPMLIISLVGALLVAYLSLGGWLVVPLALHLGGCIGDLWIAGMLLLQPGGTVVEDLRTGVRFHRPVA